MVDSNYREVLKFIVDEMYKYLASVDENDQNIREISDLREDGGVYSMEKALIKIYDTEKDIQNFDPLLEAIFVRAVIFWKVLISVSARQGPR